MPFKISFSLDKLSFATDGHLCLNPFLHSHNNRILGDFRASQELEGFPQFQAICAQFLCKY